MNRMRAETHTLIQIIGSRRIFCRLKHSRAARHLRLAVYSSGEVVLTAPWGLALKHLEAFVRSRAPWVFGKLEYFKQRQPVEKIKSDRAEYAKNKLKAAKLIKRKLKFWNQNYQFQYSRVTIRDQSTRWGSCSRKGGLNFNYKVVYLPEHLVDYLVVHELCHLREFNHSEKFWALIGRKIPDYAVRRKELKNYEKF